jgi:cell division protein FtsB
MQDVRRHKESFFHSRFWIGFLLTVCVILGLSTFRMYKKYIHAQQIKNDYYNELIQVQNHATVLKNNIDALSTDRGKESEIRDRYRVVKEGEQMILIVDNNDKETSENSVPEPMGWRARVIYFFKNL